MRYSVLRYVVAGMIFQVKVRTHGTIFRYYIAYLDIVIFFHFNFFGGVASSQPIIKVQPFQYALVAFKMKVRNSYPLCIMFSAFKFCFWMANNHPMSSFSFSATDFLMKVRITPSLCFIFMFSNFFGAASSHLVIEHFVRSFKFDDESKE